MDTVCEGRKAYAIKAELFEEHRRTNGVTVVNQEVGLEEATMMPALHLQQREWTLHFPLRVYVPPTFLLRLIDRPSTSVTAGKELLCTRNRSSGHFRRGLNRRVALDRIGH
jgi:hypothetical protein